jgi:hypothetical protein
MPTRQITDRGITYVPRCVTKVVQRTEYYASRRDEFHLSIAFKIHEEIEISGEDSKSEPHRRIFELHSSYRSFHVALWNAVLTPPCEHITGPPQSTGVLTKLGPDVAAGTGLDWDNEGENDSEVTERICVLLVRGDRSSRWLAVESAGQGDVRFPMLRTTDRCDHCAVEAAAARVGKWAVIP